MNTSVSHTSIATKSTKARREYEREMLENEIFGAFYLAVKARRREDSLTQNDLSERLGRDKTRTSKLLSGPQNWQLGTMADLARALNLSIEFSLRDEQVPGRRFSPTGVSYVSPTDLQNMYSQMTESIAQFAMGCNQVSGANTWYNWISSKNTQVQASPYYSIMNSQNTINGVYGGQIARPQFAKTPYDETSMRSIAL
jgi:transcriptional regulator with XRE-family HTH domain